MFVISEEEAESFLRKRLEYCYDQRLLEEAILIGNLLDKMQCLLLNKEQEKDSLRKPSLKLSYELIHA